MVDKQLKKQSHSCPTDGIIRHGIQHTARTDSSAVSQSIQTEGLHLQGDGDPDTIGKGLYDNVGDFHCSYPGSTVGEISFESFSNVLPESIGRLVIRSLLQYGCDRV